MSVNRRRFFWSVVPTLSVIAGSIGFKVAMAKDKKLIEVDTVYVAHVREYISVTGKVIEAGTSASTFETEKERDAYIATLKDITTLRWEKAVDPDIQKYKILFRPLNDYDRNMRADEMEDFGTPPKPQKSKEQIYEEFDGVGGIG